MKYRCQCPRPDYVVIDSMESPRGFRIGGMVEFDNNILHFSSATHFCAKCGAGICEDCCVPYLGVAHIKEDGTIEDELISGLCQSCAELEAA